MITTEVLIIGAGPVGTISALSLAQLGVSCVLVDKRLDRLDAPKAHAVNPRTLEICQRLDISADDIRAAGASVDDGGLVHFMDTLTSTCFGSLPYERQDEGARAFTPWPLVNIAQPRFEAFLSARLSQCANVSLLRGVSAVGVEESATGVTTTLRGAGMAADLEVASNYVIAADGAGSTIREALDISMTGPEGLAHNMMIHFEADLSKLTAEHPGLLYFCMAPGASGVFIGYERSSNWVFMQAYDPATQSRDNFDDATCKKLIEAAAGSPIADLRIRNVSPWSMCAQVADGYRQGRVFLAGDAAHRFPPTGGLGLNTGVADAANLSWKLAQVLQRQADEQLLDSYETERRPVAAINSHQSLTNSAKMMHLFSALYGPDPSQTATHYEAACCNPTQLPEVIQAVEIQRPHFDSFNLQLGYQYGSEVNPDDIDISDYVPGFEPGQHLPLIQISEGPWLLGLLPPGQFALVTGPAGDGWADHGLPVFIEGQQFHPTGKPLHTQADLAPDGALLIRPDGHIAARWTNLPEAPGDTLQSFLQQHYHTSLTQTSSTQNRRAH